MFDIHYSDSGGTSNMNFSFIKRMSVPTPESPGAHIFCGPLFAFSADGSKFAMAWGRGGGLVWDIRSRVPLKALMEDSKYNHDNGYVRRLQFSSGKLGKEVLVLLEVRQMLIF